MMFHALLLGALALLKYGDAQTGATKIRVDQVGYLLNSPKLAIVLDDANVTTGTFTVGSWDSGVLETVFTGQLSASIYDHDTADTVRVANFTNYMSGCQKCVVTVDGIQGTSFSFKISDNSGLYKDLFRTTMRGYYVQRSGYAVDMSPDYPGYSHAVCHEVDERYHWSSGKNGTKKASIRGQGWHDAGDFGRYVVNGGITCGTLLWAYEMYGSSILGSANLGIPESGADSPDVLSEIRWNLDWMMSMQDDDGGVFHKQTSEQFAGFIMPELDLSTQYVIGLGYAPWKGTCATADVAAVMAIAARLFEKFEPDYAALALNSSQMAWNWAVANPTAYFKNPTNVSTGEYGDGNCYDELLWAASELYRTTSNESYHEYFLTNYESFMSSLYTPPGWPNVGSLGLLSYALNSNGAKNQTVSQSIISRATSVADTWVQRAAGAAYHHTAVSSDYFWGSNSQVLNYAMQLLVTHQLSSNTAYVDTALENLHYILGRNTFSRTFVTQVGSSYPLNPHHRLSFADGIQLPWPGLIVGGPDQNKDDTVVQQTFPYNITAPATVYTDQTMAYSTNEVAINWQAPLVFTIAAMLPNASQPPLLTYTPTDPPTVPSTTAAPTASPTVTANQAMATQAPFASQSRSALIPISLISLGLVCVYGVYKKVVKKNKARAHEAI